MFKVVPKLAEDGRNINQIIIDKYSFLICNPTNSDRRPKKVQAPSFSSTINIHTNMFYNLTTQTHTTLEFDHIIIHTSHLSIPTIRHVVDPPTLRRRNSGPVPVVDQQVPCPQHPNRLERDPECPHLRGRPSGPDQGRCEGRGSRGSSSRNQRREEKC